MKTLSLLCACGVISLVGCGGSSSSSSNSVPQPLLAISAPADNSIVRGAPVQISVTTSNLSTPSQLMVLLNGSDITAQLTASGGTWSGSVQPPAINYGENQIQARYQDVRANSSFVFDTAMGGDPQGTGATTLLVPIQTRVLRNNDPTVATNWGIQVGTNTYWANPPVNCSSGPCNRGMQFLLLNRQDLSLVSNNTYEVDDVSGILGTSPFTGALNATSQMPGVTGCAPSNCLLVMQSLTYVPWNGCWGESVGNCNGRFAYKYDLEYEALNLFGLGATDMVMFANWHNSNVGYSFIGNAGNGDPVNPGNNGGSGYEKLGCSDTRTDDNPIICDNLGAFSSSGNSPADPSKTGAISGTLIRDNYNSFTFAPNAPHISYTFSTTSISGTLTNVVSINASTVEGNGQYSMPLPQGSRGGFRLLLLDATDPDGTSCRTCSSGAKQYDAFYDIDSIGELHSLVGGLVNDDQGGHDADSLVFLASIGDISHNNETSGPCHVPNQTDSFSCVWNDLANAVGKIGGDPLTFKIAGDIHPAFNADHKDDYLLIGRPIPPLSMLDSGLMVKVPQELPPLNAPETGYAIRRHTVSSATSPTSVEGVLVQDHEGYYFPRVQGSLQGLVPPQVTSVASASVQLPVPWPYSSTQGQQNAYTYISQQLCCSDIRASYVNLNVSPENWLTLLEQLGYPPSQSTNFSQADFNDVKGQLAIEFQFVSGVRNLESNVFALYQSQQSNVALILQQAQDGVLADIYGSNNPPMAMATPWSVFTSDVFPILEDLAGVAGPLSGTAFRTALGLGTLIINTAVDRTNDPSGNSQLSIALAHQELAGANLAAYAVNQYTDSLVTLGNDFNRVLSDWGRLRAVGGPIVAGQLQWDSTASGYFLRGFNLAARRQFYPTLFAANPQFFVVQNKYADDHYYGSNGDYVYGNNNGCDISVFHSAQDNGGYYVTNNNTYNYTDTAWYPGVIQSSSGSGGNPGAFWWDIWAFGDNGTNDHCPNPGDGDGDLPNNFGMFDAIDQNNPASLGIWKPYFFQRTGLMFYPHKNEYFNNEP